LLRHHIPRKGKDHGRSESELARYGASNFGSNHFFHS